MKKAAGGALYALALFAALLIGKLHSMQLHTAHHPPPAAKHGR